MDNIRSKVEEIIQKRWNELKNPNSLLSLNTIEKQTNQGYNGRQLLELFQNCEDESAKNVKICLNTNTQTLEISNDGQSPFSVKGYESIFYPGLSSKVSSGFIGNKGLGFRSIINWAKKIKIISNDFSLVFDHKLKKDILLNKIGYTEEELKEIRIQRKLQDDFYPLPLLNCCEIKDLERKSEFTTTISVEYDHTYEKSIINQLNSINEKTLLFLENIEKIEIDYDGSKRLIQVSRKKISDNKFEITSAGKKYYVIDDSGIVDEELVEDRSSTEPKKYSVKIAYDEDLSLKDKVLYNYFMTQIPFELPFVAHASLELDQNRNHATDTNVNPFILEKLFDLHKELIEELKMHKESSWIPYMSVDVEGIEIYKPYKDLIDNAWSDLKIFPIFSGDYVNMDIAKDLGNSIAEFMQLHNLESRYEKQLVFCPYGIDPFQYVDTPENYVSIIEHIAQDLTIDQRADFICLLLANFKGEKFSILIDENGKFIDKEDYVYTDKTPQNKNLRVPWYSNIKFLNSELYKLLLNKLNLNENTSNKSRKLTEKLEKISNIHSFEPATVIKKIISETNNFFKSNNYSEKSVICDFYRVLFFNYSQININESLNYDGPIFCLNQLNELVDIRTLVLSDEFKSGKLSKEILGDVYNDTETLGNLKSLGLESKNQEEVEKFLKWLGVNLFTIVQKVETGIDYNYLQILEKKTSGKNSRINKYQVFNVKNIDKILSSKFIDVNKIIIWLHLDLEIKSIFSDFKEKKDSTNEFFKYSYFGESRIYDFNNYIYYKLVSGYGFKNYLISNKKNEWFNPFEIDYDYLLDIDPKLDKVEVDRILSFLGAKTDFNELEISFLKSKTQELANRNNEKGAQVFYKSLVSHYKHNNNKILNIDLYAKQGNSIVVKNSNEIFFSDRIQLPESLTSKFPILYYPSRSGGANAIKMFGLNDLSELDLSIVKKQENYDISSDFEIFIKEIKPFILSYRLDKITKEDVKESQVRLLNKLKIECCSELICDLEGEIFEIEPFSYVFVNDVYYFKIPSNLTISEIKSIKLFRGSLSDIFLKVFDTQDEKKIFESIIMQTKEDNIYDLKNEVADGILEESKILLGEISVRLSIWKTIFRLKQIDIYSDLNENNLEEYLDRFFPDLCDTNLFRSDDNLTELNKIKNVFDFLKIDIIEFNNISDYKLSFDLLFERQLNQFFEVIKKNIKDQLWKYLISSDIQEKSKFLDYLHKVENLVSYYKFIEKKSMYDFKKIINSELNKQLPFLSVILENEFIEDYNSIKNQNDTYFTEDELLELRKDKVLNSLSFFADTVEHIKSELLSKQTKESEELPVVIDVSSNPQFISDFKIETIELKQNPIQQKLWLGNDKNDLSHIQKKKLGNSVETIIFNYLTSNPEFYSKVELIAQTNEAAHYDIKYYDIQRKQIIYVESKYYNGNYIDLSWHEKEFGDENHKQYEIWLVDKHSKIFVVDDIKRLGDLQPIKYRVKIKLKEHSEQNILESIE